MIEQLVVRHRYREYAGRCIVIHIMYIVQYRNFRQYIMRTVLHRTAKLFTQDQLIVRHRYPEYAGRCTVLSCTVYGHCTRISGNIRHFTVQLR
jgi:hypothetical protein